MANDLSKTIPFFEKQININFKQGYPQECQPDTVLF